MPGSGMPYVPYYPAFPHYGGMMPGQFAVPGSEAGMQMPGMEQTAPMGPMPGMEQAAPMGPMPGMEQAMPMGQMPGMEQMGQMPPMNQMAPMDFDDDDESPFMPQMPAQNAGFAPQDHQQNMPFMGQMGMPNYPMPGQMPYGGGPYPEGCCPPLSPVLPGAHMPYGALPYGQPMAPFPQVQGVAGFGQPFPGMPGEMAPMPHFQGQFPEMTAFQMPQGMNMPGAGDCGCAQTPFQQDGAHFQQAMGGFPSQPLGPGFQQGEAVAPAGTPYPQAGAEPFHQGGMPFPEGAGMNQLGTQQYQQGRPPYREEQKRKGNGGPTLFTPPFGQQGLYASPFNYGEFAEARITDESSEYEG